MKVAQKRNAVQEGMFYFRKDIFKGGWNKKCSFRLMLMLNASGGSSWYICIVPQQAATRALMAPLLLRTAWRLTELMRSTCWWALTPSSMERWLLSYTGWLFDDFSQASGVAQWVATSTQLLDGRARHFVQTFMFPRGWILLTFPLASPED